MDLSMVLNRFEFIREVSFEETVCWGKVSRRAAGYESRTVGQVESELLAQ